MCISYKQVRLHACPLREPCILRACVCVYIWVGGWASGCMHGIARCAVRASACNAQKVQRLCSERAKGRCWFSDGAEEERMGEEVVREDGGLGGHVRLLLSGGGWLFSC